MNRIFNIVLTDINLDNLKLQEKLEREINSTSDVENQLANIKSILTEMVNNDLMLSKFTALITPTQQKTNDGQV